MSQPFACLLLAVSTALSCALPTAVVEPASSAPTEVVAQAPAESAMPEAPAEAEAQPSENQLEVYVNGQNVPNARSVVDDGVTYVSAFHVAQALCPDTAAGWDGDSMCLTGSGFAMTIRLSQPYLVCNERYLYVPDQVRLHEDNGDVLIPVRTLAKALGAEVNWDPSGIYLTPGTPLESGSTFYSAQDLDLIARVVQHESGNQPLAGKIGVANAILNRVKSPQFPNTVSGVLNQKNQFPGATNATPKPQAILAAKLAMDGANTVGNACWFNGVGKPCWASKNKNLIVVIGNHAFYG